MTIISFVSIYVIEHNSKKVGASCGLAYLSLYISYANLMRCGVGNTD